MIIYFNFVWKIFIGNLVDEVLGCFLFDFVYLDDIVVLCVGMLVFWLWWVDVDYCWMCLQFSFIMDVEECVINCQGVLIEFIEIGEQVLMDDCQCFLWLLECIDGVVWEVEFGVGNIFLSLQVECLFGYVVEEWCVDLGFWCVYVYLDDLFDVLVIDEVVYYVIYSYVYEMSYWLIVKFGQVVWVCDFCCVDVELGWFNCMIGLMIDVIWQKYIELELLQLYYCYVLVICGFNDGIWDWNLQIDELYVFECFNEIVGFDQGDILYLYGWNYL